MDGTILSQGSFTSSGAAYTIMVPSNLDWLRIYNFTQASATAGNGYMFYWQRGMGTQGVVHLSGGAHAVTVNTTASNAFSIYDPNNSTTYALNNGSTGISAWSNATPPVITVGSTSGLSAGVVIRLTGLATSANTSIVGYNGIDFSAGYGTFSGTTMSLDYVNGGVTTTSTGNFRVVGFPITTTNGFGIITTDGLFYPRRRYITNISAATSAVITLSVQHNFSVGQAIRLSLPGGSAVWGNYAALDNYQGGQSASTSPNYWTITAVDTATGNGHNTITINADTSSFGSFAFPTTNNSFTAAQVIPVGENESQALSSGANDLLDATRNVGFLGMTLAAGAALPAGSTSDVIYWAAGKSAYGGL